MQNLTWKQQNWIDSRITSLEMEANRYKIRANLINGILEDYIDNSDIDVNFSTDDFILEIVGDLTFLLTSDSVLEDLLIKDELKYCPYTLVKNPDYIPLTTI